MGGGYWKRSDFETYSSSRGRTLSAQGIVTSDNLQDFYRENRLHQDLNPLRVTRECCDSAEHPNTVPVILGLDVTGSMGKACLKTAQALNHIMTSIYDAGTIPDVEFMVMGIGDFAYDAAPLQVSQFESDVRIAEHLDKIYIEKGGGGNGYESYTAAWYFALHHTALDCWKRGKKGIIITMGDEALNPYLPKYKIKKHIGDDNLEADIETPELYQEVIEKFDVYHIAIDDKSSSYRRRYKERVDKTFGEVLGENYYISTIDELPDVIVNCIKKSYDPTLTIDMPTDASVDTTTIVGGDIKYTPEGYVTW